MGKYKGILNKTAPYVPPEYWMVPEDIGFHDYARERENALFEHFGIERRDSDAWRDLALSLAENHVPAYQRPKGRPQVNGFEDILWYRFFVIVKQRAKCTDKDAYDLIAARHDISNSAIEIKERLKRLKRNHPLACKNVDRHFDSENRTYFHEEWLLQEWAQTFVPKDKKQEIIEHEQKFSRFPYGPYQDPFPE